MGSSKKLCIVCKNQITGRHRTNDVCSLKCENEQGKVFLENLQTRIAATTAWRPIELDPITEIVTGHPVLVISDPHAPIHSAYWIELALRFAKKYDARTLILNGDFIDANTISRHLGGYYRRKNELEDDLAAGEALLKLFSEQFEKVYFLSGNHCMQRLLKVFNGEVQSKRLWNLFGTYENVKVTARSFVHVNNNIIVGHPRQYSGVRGNLPQKIAQLKQKHVILGHGHHSAKAITADGRWQAVDVPCAADIEAFEYVRNEINSFAEPINGFCMIFGEKILVVDKFTPLHLYGVDDVSK